jgi:hypothetical protein
VPIEPTYQQTPQDSVKKTLPQVIPAGRVEGYHEFSDAPLQEERPQEQPIEKKMKSLPKLEPVKPQPPVAQKPTPKPELPKVVVQEPVAQKEAPKPLQPDTASPQAQVQLPEITGYKFLSDSVRKPFGLLYVQKEVGEEDALLEEEMPFFDWTPSVFTGHQLQPLSNGPLDLAPKGSDGLVIAFVAVLGIFSMVKVAYYKKVNQYLTAFFNLRINSQMLRAEKSVDEQLYAIMLIASVLVSSTLLYQLFRYYNISLYPLDNLVEGFAFLKIFTIALVAIGIKFLVIKFSGLLFNAGRLASDYIFNQVLFFNILNLALFPICITLQYNSMLPESTFFIAGGALGAIAFIFMFQRLFALGNSEAGTSSYYLFLYLCTLEILPLVILAKLLIEAIG